MYDLLDLKRIRKHGLPYSIDYAVSKCKGLGGDVKDPNG